MYRSCIFCSADLGTNDSLERFPIGRSIAFDGEKGRLWAICPRCARWNLAPLEERWEAIEDGERLFRDSRLRAQSENVGLAQLRDGTRLIRVGQALPGELAVWRYGEQIARRRRRNLLIGATVVAGGVGVVVAGAAVASVGFGSWATLYQGYHWLVRRAAGKRTVGWVDAEVPGAAQRVRIRREDAAGAWLSAPDDGAGIALNLPLSVEAPDPRRPHETRRLPLIIRGAQAQRVMARAMVNVNVDGADQQQIEGVLRVIEAAGSPQEYLVSIGRRRLALNGADPRAAARMDLSWGARNDPEQGPPPNRLVSLVLEMALHEETERQALAGELSMLEAMWREAEEIAAIADRLPDHLPPAEPPRM
ncbi:MAG TPA: hypothetical protein VLK84_21405 [Longimicrobium sp.]|nr:hypothetical protein [Longimicrobium sp.]